MIDVVLKEKGLNDTQKEEKMGKLLSAPVIQRKSQWIHSCLWGLGLLVVDLLFAVCVCLWIHSGLPCSHTGFGASFCATVESSNCYVALVVGAMHSWCSPPS